MASPSYEGGIGGKFRKRPFRRAPPASPYERPPTALRGVRGGGGGESRGWISRLVDPASRLIASGASKLFSSMFQPKRLTEAPPKPPEEDHQSREDAPQTAEAHQGALTIDDRDEDNHSNNSENGGIVELEQLLKQKTFTRVESDHLAELLRSRTIEPLKLETEIKDEKKENAYVSVQEDKIESSKVNESLSVPAGSLTIRKQIPIDEAASPAELAKAYMGLRTSKASPLAGSLQNQEFWEDKNSLNIPSTSKQLDQPVASRSVVRFSGITEHPERGSQTPKPVGRSAIYRMSRSPYFKANPMRHVQVGEFPREGYAYTSSSSQRTTRSALHSGGKQVLKRRSSVLDSDIGSFGPIRRLRQKSDLLSPSKDVNSPLSGSQTFGLSNSLSKDPIKGSMSLSKPPQLVGSKYGITGSLAAGNGNTSTSSFPQQSREKAQELLQYLSDLYPSPNEKTFELKAIAQDTSPSELTFDLPHRSALRIEGSGKLNIASTSNLPNFGGSQPRQPDTVKENGPSKPAVLGVKLSSEACGVRNALVTSNDTEPVPVPKSLAFQVSVPEDPLELADDEKYMKSLSIPIFTGKDGSESKMYKNNSAISEAAVSAKPLFASSQSSPISSSVSCRKTDKKAPIQPVVTKKDSSFAFPVAVDSFQSQPPPTPTMPAPLLERSDTQNGQISPAFSFALKGTPPSTFSSTTVSANDTIGTKAGEGSGSKPNLSTSVTTSSAEGSRLNKPDITQEAGVLSKPFGNSVSLVISSTSSPPPVFAFGASAATSLSNGSLDSFSSASSFPSSPASSLSGVPSFQFGSGCKTASHVSNSGALDKSSIGTLEKQPVEASLSSSSIQSISAMPTNFSSGSSSSALPALTVTSSTGSSSSVLPSSASPNAGYIGFGFSASVQSTTRSSHLFANSSTQNSVVTTIGNHGGPTSSSPLFSDNSSQTASISSSGGSMFGTQPTQSASGTSQISQASTSQFGSFSSSPAFGLGNFSSGSTDVSPFGSVASGVKPITPSPGFPFSAGTGSSAGLFGSSAQASTPSVFGSASSSNTPPFGLSDPNSGSSPFVFGSSSISSSPSPVFGMPNPAIGFSSGSPGNDQMNVEDSMTDDTNQAAAVSTFPSFGQPTNTPTAPSSVFGSQASQPGGSPIMFGGNQNPSIIPQNPSPFQPAGNAEFTPTGGSFSLGSGGGGDKPAGRRIVKVKRDRLRKK